MELDSVVGDPYQIAAFIVVGATSQERVLRTNIRGVCCVERFLYFLLIVVSGCSVDENLDTYSPPPDEGVNLANFNC